jgi:spermidine/putrescine transport system substrate-binding protein
MPRPSRRSFLKFSALTGAAAALAGCQRAPLREAPLLNLHNWPEYLNPDTAKRFWQETDIFINQTIFESNEHLLADLQNALPGTFDLITPTDHMVRRLIEQGALLKLDPAQLPNLRNVQAAFRSGRAYDPRGEYSVPKNWGTSGILYRPDTVTEPPMSWADFWSLARQHSGRVVVVEARDEVISAALKLLGYSINETDPARLAEAERKMRELRPHVGLSSDYFSMFQNNLVVLGLGWNGDAFVIRQEYETPVSYTIPSEGSVLWEDNWCLPATALHPRNAHAFINFVLQPEVAALESSYLGYATVVEPALSLLDPALRNDLSLYPTAEVMSRLERLQTFDADTVRRRTEIWERFLAG